MENIRYTRPLSPNLDSLKNRLDDVFKSQWLTNFGFQHKTLEKMLSEYLKVKNIQLICNGTVALEIAYKSLELTGNVITTPFTFAATTTSMYWCGIEPKFCDINSDTLNINVDNVEKLIDENTSAIVAVHVFGNPCDVNNLKKISEKHNVKLIYDAAHCFGVEYDSKSILNYGDVSTLSFHATKVFNTIEGGCIVTQDESIKDKIHCLRNFGFNLEKDKMNIDSVILPGINGKMSELHAAIGIENLARVDEEIRKRNIVYDTYAGQLRDIEEIKIVIDDKKDNMLAWNYSYMPILVNKNRNIIVEDMANIGITLKKYFYPLCSDFSYMKKKWDLPIAKDISERVICLPMYGDLTEEQIKYICNSLKNILKQ